MAKKKKKSKAAADLTLYDVILSYPQLHEPKPFKGKIYYKTDVLLDEDHPQLGELRKLIHKVKTEQWGPDKEEWPRPKKPHIQDGNMREDQKGYKGRKYIVPQTQSPVPIIDLQGKAFAAQRVRGGMFANVAVRISIWENEGEEGLNIYLQAVQIDTKKKPLNFGGGKTVEQMFKLQKGGDGDEGDGDGNEDEENDTPRGKKKKARDFDDEEE